MLPVCIRCGFNRWPLVNNGELIDVMRVQDEIVYRIRTITPMREMQFADRFEIFYETRIVDAQICGMGVCYLHAL